MLERLLIAGSGGQGIILAGRILASVAVKATPHVTFFPSYGAEVRGGMSACHVILSSREIASPVSEQNDTLIIMNQESLNRFRPQMSPRCLAVVNASLCNVKPARNVLRIRATDIANSLGDTRSANFIMLGAYLSVKRVIPPAHIEKGIRELLAGKNRDMIELNIKAFRSGLRG